METFQIPCLWTCFLMSCEVPNSGQNPGKNQQDVGSLVTFPTQDMESWKSFEGPQLPRERPVATWDGHFH